VRRADILEDDLRLFAERAQRLGWQAREIGPVEFDTVAALPQQLPQQTAVSGFAAAALADEAQDFAGRDRERDVIHVGAVGAGEVAKLCNN